MNKKVVVIVGPTGAGKTAASLLVAHALNGEVVSADSMQLYRGMDIGTAKLAEEEREGIAHHLIDVSDPDEPMTVAEYQQMALAAIDSILSRNKLPIVCGGSGLYVHSITHGLDFGRRTAPSYALRQEIAGMSPESRYELLLEKAPSAAARIHPNNQVRVIRALEMSLTGDGLAETQYDLDRPRTSYEFIVAGISPDRAMLCAALDQRVSRMVALGLVDEVRELRSCYGTSRVISQAIGYKELIGAETDQAVEQGIAEIKKNTRRLAKRQMTWFRRDKSTVWFPECDEAMIAHVVSEVERV